MKCHAIEQHIAVEKKFWRAALEVADPLLARGGSS